MAGSLVDLTLSDGIAIHVGTVEAVPGGGLTTEIFTTPIGIYGSALSATAYFLSGSVHPGPLSSANDSAKGSAPVPATTPPSSADSSVSSPPVATPGPTQPVSSSPALGIVTATGTPDAAGTNVSQSSGSPTTTPNQSNNGLSGGAVGGIAAACIVGAALIAGLLVWAIMRNRLKHYRNLAAGAAAGSSYDGTGAPEKGMRSGVAPVVAGADTAFLAGILPPASDDKDVKQRVNGILEAAAIHVDNFYDNTKIGVPAEVAGQLAQFDSPTLPRTTNEMLSQGMKPKVIITRALTEMIVSCIDPQAPSRSSLLPTEYTALPNSLHGAGRDFSSRQDGPALFWWRQLSVHLGPKTQENNAYLEARGHAIRELISNFQTTFRPWRKTRYTEKQETDALVGTFTSAADTGVWLFSQRSTFSFLWGRTVPPGEIETRPTLVKTSDANGQPLSKPREVVQRQIERTGSGAL